MKKLLLSLIPFALSLIAFIILWQTFANPHQEYYDGENTFPFAEGNAPPGIRDSIITQLEYFEKGYLERYVEILEEYCNRLISKENILILGTMPQEIYSGYEAAAELIRTDWLNWGDVYYLMDQAHVSVQNEVAWISTIGYVEFDMSRFLVLPLRYSAVMVKEDASWKFQQMQFQFDLDNMKILMAIIVLLLSTAIFFTRFVVILFRYGIKTRNKS
ncbi:MAG: nuclear transport factor 2 family protein [Bacteroidales bacterium]|nr:nuclear transport factor 2 family protein [Bacteroidales bacterium]